MDTPELRASIKDSDDPDFTGESIPCVSGSCQAESRETKDVSGLASVPQSPCWKAEKTSRKTMEKTVQKTSEKTMKKTSNGTPKRTRKETGEDTAKESASSEISGAGVREREL